MIQRERREWSPAEEPRVRRPNRPRTNTVFHFSAGTDEQGHALANVENLLADAATDAEDIVLVANGRGVELLAASTSEHPERVASLARDGVSFRACRNSMESRGVIESALVEGVETVPAGVVEIATLQARDGDTSRRPDSARAPRSSTSQSSECACLKGWGGNLSSSRPGSRLTL